MRPSLPEDLTLLHRIDPSAGAACRLAAAALLVVVAPAGVHATGLGYTEAQTLARDGAPLLRAQQAQLAGAGAARRGAESLPDPRLTVGVDNLPIAGMERFSTTRDASTMQRVALMQEVPNRAKREARAAIAEARIERDRAQLAVVRIAVQRDAALAWLGVWAAERRQALIDEFRRENRLLQATFGARIAAATVLPAEATMARQEALAIADRADDLARATARARAELRRWVGSRADEPLEGEPAPPPVDAARVRERIAASAELRAYAPMRAMAAGEMAEMEAEQRGDWSWEFAYSRRPKYDDMVSLMLRFDLPWQRAERQQPQVRVKRHDIERIEAERDDLALRLVSEAEALLAELRAADVTHERLADAGMRLAAERVSLATASYSAGRTDLGPVLAARMAALEARMKLIELDAARAALRVRLAALVAEE